MVAMETQSVGPQPDHQNYKMVWLWVVDGCHGNPVSWTTINLIIKIINRASGCWLPDVIDNAGICGKSSNYIISLPASSSSIFLFFLTALRSEPAWQCPEDHKFKTKRSACVKNILTELPNEGCGWKGSYVLRKNVKYYFLGQFLRPVCIFDSVSL